MSRVASEDDVPERVGTTLTAERDRRLWAQARHAVATEHDVDPEDLSRPAIIRELALAYLGAPREDDDGT
jgi:hypothetical protein